MRVVIQALRLSCWTAEIETAQAMGGGGGIFEVDTVNVSQYLESANVVGFMKSALLAGRNTSACDHQEKR